MTRFLVSIFHFLVILFAIAIIILFTIIFSSVPFEFLNFLNVNLSNDSYRLLAGFVGFILGTLFVIIFFGVLLVSLEMNKNIRRILNILENKNLNKNINKTPPEL